MPASEPILGKRNLDRIKNYIIAQGRRCTYSNMYNNNPCFDLAGVRLYLNPDPGPDGHPQWNINCDISRGDFNTLVLHDADGYRTIDFRDAGDIRVHEDGAAVESATPASKRLPETVVLEMLKLMQAGESGRPPVAK